MRTLKDETWACLLTKSEIFERCGGFDPLCFNGDEDVAFCLRVRRLGHRVLYCGSSLLARCESQRRNALVLNREAENRRLFVARWKPGIAS